MHNIAQQQLNIQKLSNLHTQNKQKGEPTTKQIGKHNSTNSKKPNPLHNCCHNLKPKQFENPKPKNIPQQQPI